MRTPAAMVVLLSVLPSAAFAASTISIDGRPLSYTETFSKDTDDDGKPDRLSYYDGDRLVASAFDRDGDGEYDTWITFDEQLRPTSEVVDRDRDGEVDIVRSVDERGHAGPSRPTPPQPPAPAPERSAPGPSIGREHILDFRFMAAVGVAVLGLLGGLVLLRRG